MKLFDKVKLLKNQFEYQEKQIYKDMIRDIWNPVIRYNCFLVRFYNREVYEPDKLCYIRIEDLEVIEEWNLSDEKLSLHLTEKYQDAYCKVEEGYIVNLKGNRKNKIPYDYNS